MSFLNLTVGFVFLAAGALLLLAAALAYGRHRRRRVIGRFVGPVMARQVVNTVHPGRRRLRAGLLVAGVVLALLAAARPWWGQRLVPAPQRSRDLLVALDCSRSMLAKDVTPSRLEHAKWLVRELARRFPGDRLGLIAFAGEAFLECPLTMDRSTLYTFLDDMDTATIPVGGTNLDTALAAVEKAFKGAEGGDRAVILLSDGGDELQGDELKHLDFLRQQGVPLLVIGLGNPAQATPIQLPDNTFLRDAGNRMVSTRLNEGRLRRLAQETGGVYVRTTTVEPNLEAVVARVKAMIPEEDEQTVTLRPIDRFQVPLALAVLCLIARLFIGERRSPASVAGAALASLLLLAPGLCPNAAGQAPGPVPSATPPTPPADAPPTPDAEVEALRAALAKAPAEEAARRHYNLGVKLHGLGDPDGAENEYQAALGAAQPDPETDARARWNLGAIRHVQARQALQSDPAKALVHLDEAQSFYREAMRRLPGQPNLAANQEQLLTERRLAEELKKIQDELRRKQQAAVKETAEALAKQRQAGQPQEETSRGGELSEASRQTAKARDAAADLEEYLEPFTPPATPPSPSPPPQAGQPQAPEPANMGRQAREAIEQAMQAQERAAQQARTEESREEEMAAAAQRLEEALRALGAQPGQPPQEGQGDSQQQQAQNQEGEQPGQSQPPPQPGEGQKQDQELMEQLAQQEAEQRQAQAAAEAGTAEQNGQAYDKDQARAIIMQMQDQERELRRELKMHRMQQSRLAPVEKDW